jgi:hypothetical protein
LRFARTIATLRVVMSEIESDARGPLPEGIVELIAADLISTLRWPQADAKTFVRQNSGAWCAGFPRLLLVAEDLQQRLHDDRIDTTWPACPDHPHHPLRLTHKLPARWTCPSDGRVIAALGGLGSRQPPED